MSPETTDLLGRAPWRKSSHSGDQGACVEYALLAGAADDVVAVRDSKDTAGPVLTFAPAAWTAFTTALPTSPVLP
ncbi:hypothetical protein GCM10022225_04340 [Plantactinospora mayteni]|uniref:DUF397 domain-containing protein n=1 Tax=Plantactinospora mayteni TaxID=566021 RepID=A0ABQ4EQH9_9ACTN|nr:DUF397 domain-containing protein [Plantactinospora mayteni]GIG96923.1 hypothetical protein Pma05_34960 [Plantactinospora mayteni]